MASVKVAVRVRPINDRETRMKSSIIIEVEENRTLLTNTKLPTELALNALDSPHTLGRERVKQFTFDHSYTSVSPNTPQYATQEKIFNDLGYDVVQSAYEGYNACVFAYGQTGSGKTYTMMGTQREAGIIPRICELMFTKMNDPNTTYRTEVSYLEIYNEHVRDLLRDKPSKPSGGLQQQQLNLKIREHPKDGPYVQDLSKHIVVNYEEIAELMRKGNENRTTAATNMNDMSSRSHAIFTIVFAQAKFEDDIPMEKASKIHLVDLAGSERVDASGATGVRLKEGSSINKSLVTLGKIISSLADATDRSPSPKKNVFIPYRDSVLTWLLKDSLGGNAKTIMIATVSPADCNYAETLSTLRYASRAKRIVNKPIINEDPNVTLIRELREENKKLKALLDNHKLMDESATRAELEIEKNEEKVKVLTEQWAGKWQDIALILHEHKTLALRKEGSGVVLDSDLPYLLALDQDILSTGMTLYHLKEGCTLVGRDDAGTPQDIVLSGPLVEAEHCIFHHDHSEVSLEPLGDALCCVNNARLHTTCKINQGAIIKLGKNHVFRFNHPGEAAQMREEIKQKGHSDLMKMKQSNYQWSWSSQSLPDSALGSDLDLDLHRTSFEELDRIQERSSLRKRRKEVEELEEAHCLAEAQRLAALVEQEEMLRRLKEKQRSLESLKFEAQEAHSKAKMAQSKIKRLSANFEDKLSSHFEDQRQLASQEVRLSIERDRLDRERAKALRERARLRRERERSKSMVDFNRARQEEEEESFKKEKVLHDQRIRHKEMNLSKMKDHVLKSREMERDVYSRSMIEMRDFVEKEVDHMRQFSERAATAGENASMENRVDLKEARNMLHSAKKPRPQAKLKPDVQRLLKRHSPPPGQEQATLSNGALHNHESNIDISEPEIDLLTFKLSLIEGSMRRQHTDSDVESVVREVVASSSASSMTGSTGLSSEDSAWCSSTSSTHSGPVIPSQYLESLLVPDKPMETSFLAGLSDSQISQGSQCSDVSMASVGSATGLIDSCVDPTHLLEEVSTEVEELQNRVCQCLHKKYSSVLTSDDDTSGLGSEVILQSSLLNPRLRILEKMILDQDQTTRDRLQHDLDVIQHRMRVTDNFLRVHEAVQAVAEAIRDQRHLEALRGLDHVQALLEEAEIDGDLEMKVFKLFQAEQRINREQVLFHLTEVWDHLLKWTLPSDQRRLNSGQPRVVSLEVKQEEDSRALMKMVVQAMSQVNMLQTRLKILCDRVMDTFVECLVKDRHCLLQSVSDTNRSVLCVTQYPQTLKTFNRPERPQQVQAVPASEVFPKLEQVFMFLQKPFSDVTIQEEADGLVTEVTLLRKLGDILCKQLFQYIYNECLCHVNPDDGQQLESFSETIRISEQFQSLLTTLDFMPKHQSDLMDYFNDMNSLFANLKSREIMKQAHELMASDLVNSVQVSTERPLGRDPQLGKTKHGVLTESLSSFVMSCREEMGRNAQKIPLCQVSVPVRSLVCIAYGVLRDVISGSDNLRCVLATSLHNLFEAYINFIPTYQKDKLINRPLLAALHHNNCMFVANHVMTIDRQLKRKQPTDRGTPCGDVTTLGELVPIIRGLGNDNFTQHILIKKEHLCDHLNAAEGFECIADDDGQAAEEAISNMLKHLKHIGIIWQDILPSKVYCKAIGTLLNAVITDIIQAVLSIGEFSSDDCDILQHCLRQILVAGPEMFAIESLDQNPEILLHEYVSNWMKFKEIHGALRSNLQTICDRWSDGKGPLALYFQPDEVRRFILAMFENTSRRDDVLKQIR